MTRIKVAIAGVGNCASALVQGLEYYRERNGEDLEGIITAQIGPYSCRDIEVVAAFDIDRRKVGFRLEKAIFAQPNCTRVIQHALPVSDVIVQMGPILDGVAEHMADYDDDQAFRAADEEPVDVAEVLRESGAHVLVCYLPVGSEKAVQHYASACLEAGVAMVNCVPVFISSNPEWAERFRQAGLPIVGDDIKSQVGATIVHRALTRLFGDRGVSLDRTYQLNTGGNTDFLNMLERSRLRSKKRSKTESVESQVEGEIDARDIHIGPSDYVPWQGDNKIAFIRMEGRGFGDAPLELELRLSVQDSPNSAGVTMDTIRCAKLGLDRGIGGPLEAPSSYYMKRPPLQVRDSVARERCLAFIAGGSPDVPHEKKTEVQAPSLRATGGATARSALILAAGRGARLFPRATLPKPLTPIQGVTMAERVMTSLRQAASVKRFVVTLGHEADTVRPHFQSVAARIGVGVEFVEAADWEKGNGASALAAAEVIGDEPFLLSMCDHLYDEGLPARLIAAPPPKDGMSLACDFATDGIMDIDDAMKVMAADGTVAALAKSLTDWNCVDTGVMHCTPALFEGLRDAKAQGLHGLADGMNVLVKRGGVRVVDVTGCWWIDVDTREAMQIAERHEFADDLRAAS